ncbi:MAG: ABC transporter permease [Venatoribacter sp.]
MLAYIVRRTLYAFPILIGVNILTFALFFMVNTPDQMAKVQLGDKHLDAQAVQVWKAQRGYDKPLFVNSQDNSQGLLTDTIFFNKSMRLFVFDFGRSDAGRVIGMDISERMWPSLALALPTFIVGIAVNIVISLFVVMFKATRIDTTAMVICVGLMSISAIFYILGGQYFFAKMWHWVPISGYLSGADAWRFLILPVFIGVVSGIGGGVRLYRTLFLEEANKDYVRTARAKGISETRVLFKHILPNGLIPILTSVVVVIPSLFMGSLLMESFFGIPGLGSYTLDAIQAQDFAIVRSMVFLGSVLYILGLILTDISYTLVDPRVRLS